MKKKTIIINSIIFLLIAAISLIVAIIRPIDSNWPWMIFAGGMEIGIPFLMAWITGVG